jgi:hemerythrin-like domain-containing protein
MPKAFHFLHSGWTPMGIFFSKAISCQIFSRMLSVLEIQFSGCYTFASYQYVVRFQEIVKMAQPRPAHVATSFFNIHNIITRGLRVSIEGVQTGRQQGFPDEKNREGLFHYIGALCSVLNAHHLTEEEIAFPYFQEILPNAPYAALIFWHQKMLEVLDEIQQALDQCRKVDQLEANLGILENALTRLNDMWRPHIQSEMDQFFAKADALISVEEQLRLVGLFSEHDLKIAVPHPLTIPFMLYNLPPQDRPVFAQGIPAEIVQNHVPNTWKAQWEPMTPFLLV